jgi:hypothetical protein
MREINSATMADDCTSWSVPPTYPLVQLHQEWVYTYHHSPDQYILTAFISLLSHLNMINNDKMNLKKLKSFFFLTVKIDLSNVCWFWKDLPLYKLGIHASRPVWMWSRFGWRKVKSVIMPWHVTPLLSTFLTAH